MSHFKLAFLGFGNVGKALAELLLRKQEELRIRYGFTFSVTGIYTAHHGSAIACDGIELTRALAGDLTALSTAPVAADGFDFIRRCNAHVLFENSPVNYATGQPALDHIRLALEMGMHAITANKGPVVHGYQQLTELAEQNGVKFYFESTVMDGAPIFSLFRETLPAAQVLSIRGVLNSTTNLILSRMEQGESFEQAVRYAQHIGIAETDPSGDIDGWDAAVKIAALATVLMRAPLKPHQVQRQGIRAITGQDIQYALADQQRWKLVCSAVRTESGVMAKVAPELVGSDSPMYKVDNTTSIVQIETDVLGLLSILESDPGPHTTAYGLLADFVNAVRQ